MAPVTRSAASPAKQAAVARAQSRGSTKKGAVSDCAPADEFGGPIGVFLVVAGLPIFTMYMLTCMANDRDYGGLLIPSSKAEILEIFGKFPTPNSFSVGLYLGWFMLQFLLQIFAPGPLVKGVPLSNGKSLLYKMNGWNALVFTLLFSAFLCYYGVLSPKDIIDNLGPLMATVHWFASGLAVLLYACHRLQLFGLAEEKCSGNLLYDFFMGGSINPRIGSFDIKCFCESRPGLMLWMLINIAAAVVQFQEQGRVSTAMGLVLLFHSWYVVDYFWQEDAILTTMDIMHDKFGWMLCWGDLAWVPFVYSMQAQYLLLHPEIDCGVFQVVIIIGVQAIGYYIFRNSNGQKNDFRTIPGIKIWGVVPQKDVGYIQTKRGSKLLCCGFWGLSRHPNYLGDWIMGVAWCLPCGFGHALPYFYAVYFAILLIHREIRDSKHCHEKYGEDFQKYCDRVPYRIVPYLY